MSRTSNACDGCVALFTATQTQRVTRRLLSVSVFVVVYADSSLL
jgi:hypothetical protein